MDITVYLPDEIGQWAKDNSLNLSGLLREAVERRRREASEVASTLAKARLVKLDIEDDDRTFTLRFTGTPLAEPAHDVEVYLTDDERVIVYDANKLRYSEVEDPESELREWLGQDAYIEAMNTLGITPEVDLEERP